MARTTANQNRPEVQQSVMKDLVVETKTKPDTKAIGRRVIEHDEEKLNVNSRRAVAHNDSLEFFKKVLLK